MIPITIDSVGFAQHAQEMLGRAVQEHLDATARSKGYDSALSCVSYIDSTVEQYRTEATAMRDWRDAVWAACYQIMLEVQAGTRPMPSKEVLISLLPKIKS